MTCIAIEGEIGAGKTELVGLLTKHLTNQGLRVVPILEPVEEWENSGALQKFYEEQQASTIFEIQSYFLETRAESVRKAFESNPHADIFILERSLLTDRFVFMELHREAIGSDLYKKYVDKWDFWRENLPIFPTKVIYLKPTLEKCQARVESRGRGGEEEGVTFTYQTRLRRAHEAYLQGFHLEEFPDMDPHPFDVVLIIESDGDFVHCKIAADRIIEFTTTRLELASKTPTPTYGSTTGYIFD